MPVLVEQWRGYVLDDYGDTFLARFTTPNDGEVEAEVRREAVRTEDRATLQAGTYLVWDFYDDPPRADLYIPEEAKRPWTAEDVAAAQEQSARWKELFRLPDLDEILGAD